MTCWRCWTPWDRPSAAFFGLSQAGPMAILFATSHPERTKALVLYATFALLAPHHGGEVELMGTQVQGIAVHIGARIAALGGPSAVLVSSTVKDLVVGSGLMFEDAGEHELRGVPDRWHLYTVANERVAKG